MTMINPTPAPATKAETVPEEPRYDPMALLAQFNNSFGVKPFIEEDAYGRKQSIKLRSRLITEECREITDELLDLFNGHGDRAKLAKELADGLYVIYQAAAHFEIPIYAVFNAVHASNMSKLGPDGKPVRDAGGKVLKGPNYWAPDVEAILESVSN